MKLLNDIDNIFNTNTSNIIKMFYNCKQIIKPLLLQSTETQISKKIIHNNNNIDELNDNLKYFYVWNSMFIIFFNGSKSIDFDNESYGNLKFLSKYYQII